MRITEHFSKRYNNSYPKPIWENVIDLLYSIMERHLDNEEVKKCYDLMKANEEIYEGKRIIFLIVRSLVS